MADRKVTQMTAIAGSETADNDQLMLIDVSNGSDPNGNRSLTLLEAKRGLNRGAEALARKQDVPTSAALTAEIAARANGDTTERNARIAAVQDEAQHRENDFIAARTETARVDQSQTASRLAAVEALRQSIADGDTAVSAESIARDNDLDDRINAIQLAGSSGIPGPFSTEAAGRAAVADGGLFQLRVADEIHLYERINAGNSDFVRVWVGSVAVTDTDRVYAALTLAALKALPTSTAREVSVIGRTGPFDGWQGRFAFIPGDRSADVASDTYEALWVDPSSDATGASGAWRRQTGVDYWPAWWDIPGKTGRDAHRQAMVAIAAAHLTPIRWDQFNVHVRETHRVAAPGSRHICVGRGPNFILDDYTHGVFSIAREATGFTWVGNSSAEYMGVREDVSGDFGGYSAFQENCFAWVEADDFYHAGTLTTRNLFNSICLRGPVQLRDGTYPAWEDYDGIGGDDVDERENMTGVVIGEIIAHSQDFALTGGQHDGTRGKEMIWLYDQTDVIEIDAHAVYITQRGDSVFGGKCRNLHIAGVAQVRASRSMAVKLRDVEGAEFGSVYAYRSAGAVLIASRCKDVKIVSCSSVEQVENSAEPLAPASTAFDVVASEGITCGSLTVSAAEGHMVRGIVARANAGFVCEVTVNDFSIHQRADTRLVYAARAEGLGQVYLTINDAVTRRTLPFGHVATTEIDEFFAAVDEGRMWVNGWRHEGPEYYRRAAVQRDNGRLSLVFNSDLVEGYDSVTPPVDADDYALILLSDTSSRDRIGPKGGSDVVRGFVQTLTGVATPLTASGDGVAAPLYVASLTSAATFSGVIMARAAAGTANVAVWRVEGLLTRGTTPNATTIIGLTVTMLHSTPGAAAWAAPTIIADTAAGGLIAVSGAVAGTIDWTARIEAESLT